jgi:DNA polymerase-3 subunit delta
MANYGEKELKAHIKSKEFYPVYLICGDEDYLKKTYTDMIASKNVEPAFESFNLQKFEGKGLDLADVFEQASIMPMMSDKRCILIEDYKLESITDKDLSLIEEYFENPCDTSVIIFLQKKAGATISTRIRAWSRATPRTTARASIRRCFRRWRAAVRKT